MQIYVVKPGDSLWAIAHRFGSTVEALSALNQLSDPARLVPGLALAIPGGESGARRSAEVNAYVYPNVSGSVLAETLPAVTMLCPFSYAATEEGELRPIDDERLIEAAYAQGAAPLLTVTNLGESGFSSRIGHAVLTDKDVQDRVLSRILALIREKDYYGLNINFEYLYPFDRDSYSQFVSRAAELLHPLGCLVSTAIAPKESDEQPGFLYAAHDYAAHGNYADRVILMTYEWGYTFGVPQAVSPVDRIRRVLDYAVTVIPREKILMGFSNYAYDWTLPWKQGAAARLLSNREAQELAISRGAEVRYDPAAAAPWFNYLDAEGRAHVVWFEDVRSALARLDLVEEYRLAGLSVWTADRLWRPALAALEQVFDVEKLI